MSVAAPAGKSERTLAATFSWLKSRRLTATTLPIDFRDSDGREIDPAKVVLAAPQQRAKKHTQAELTQLTKSWRERHLPSAPVGGPPKSAAVEKQIDDLLDRRTSHLFLNLQRLPPHAIAFYRPFHLDPMDRWGIYVLVDRLLRYADGVRFSIPFFPNVSKEVFMHLVLFEMFHHEFYHHLVESAATTLEIVADALGAHVPSYLDYRRAVHDRAFTWHKHQPLEEALANAYAYNSLSFISRVKAGYRDALVDSYQKNLTSHWRKEGPGYRDAADYTADERVPANGDLLAMLLGRLPHPALLQVAQAVMPNGFAAFIAKPDIPTYLVGTPDQIDSLHALVPAPNETYCNLFWPLDTSRIDEMLKARHQEREATRKNQKQSR